MTRLSALSIIALLVGLVLVLSEFRWFQRHRLTDRLRDYSPVALARPKHSPFDVESFGEVLSPLAVTVGTAAARVFGVNEDLETRLRRIHSPLTMSEFRTRQVGVSTAAGMAGALMAYAAGAPPTLALLLVVGAAMLAFLVLEQQLAGASEKRQRTLFLELPVVAEQLGMLLSAGYSLGAAIQRLANRGNGVIASDLRIVVTRIQQGLSDEQALHEWSTLANVAALDRLTSILSLNRKTVDLGRLVHDEAQAIRREAHRELLATIERRDQQVWIPVTVATLLPGVMFIAVPFIEALKLFTES